MSLYHVPYSAMAPEMVSDYRERLSLVGYKEVAARLSVLLAITVAPVLIAAAPDQLTGYQYVGLAFGGLITLSGLVAFVTTANAPSAASPRASCRARNPGRTTDSRQKLYSGECAFSLLF